MIVAIRLPGFNLTGRKCVPKGKYMNIPVPTTRHLAAARGAKVLERVAVRNLFEETGVAAQSIRPSIQPHLLLGDLDFRIPLPGKQMMCKLACRMNRDPAARQACEMAC